MGSIIPKLSSQAWNRLIRISADTEEWPYYTSNSTANYEVSQRRAVSWFFLMNFTCVSQFKGGLCGFAQLFLALRSDFLIPGVTFYLSSESFLPWQERWNKLTSLSSIQMVPIKLHIRARCCSLTMHCSVHVQQHAFASIPQRHVGGHLTMHSHTIVQIACSHQFACMHTSVRCFQN